MSVTSGGAASDKYYVTPIVLPDTRARYIVEQLLKDSGVALNGNAPQDLRVYHPDFFSRLLHQGTLGLGEAYMDGWWECDRIDEMACRLLQHGLGERAHTPSERMMYRLQAGFFNLQSRARAYIVGEAHYDLGNDLFERMLDPTMCYSCGYWKEASTLHEAQQAKLELACRKLQLEPGMRVLDIGCGWGSFAEHAAPAPSERATCSCGRSCSPAIAQGATTLRGSHRPLSATNRLYCTPIHKQGDQGMAA